MRRIRALRNNSNTEHVLPQQLKCRKPRIISKNDDETNKRKVQVLDFYKRIGPHYNDTLQKKSCLLILLTLRTLLLLLLNVSKLDFQNKKNLI